MLTDENKCERFATISRAHVVYAHANGSICLSTERRYSGLDPGSSSDAQIWMGVSELRELIRVGEMAIEAIEAYQASQAAVADGTDEAGKE